MDSIGDRLESLDYSSQCTAEARRLFKKRLLEGLHRRLRLTAKAYYISDGIVVQLMDENGTEQYRKTYRNVNHMIYNSVDSDQLASDITNDFRKKVLKKYFKHTYCGAKGKML